MAKTIRETRERKVTLRDLAQQMEVNVSTVSRTLGGDPGVGQEKASAIRRMASELGYEPRPLRRKRTRAVGLIIASDRPEDPDDPFQHRVIYEVERAAAKASCTCTLGLPPGARPERDTRAFWGRTGWMECSWRDIHRRRSAIACDGTASQR